MNDVLNTRVYDNTTEDYILAIGFIVFGFLLIRIFRKIILTRARRWAESTETNLDDYVVDSIDKFGIPTLYFAILYVGISYLTLSERVDNIVRIATTMAITVMVIRFLSTVILLLLRSFIRKRSPDEEKVKQLDGLMLLVNAIIWIIGILFLFDNMGYNVTTVIAGLGIGGIAVALAAQNILGDLFNYFVIFLDRPFEIGDFIIIDEKRGVVEHIGIKTTRVKSLSGEQLVFSNSDLTNSRIHNYKRMQRRRILFNLSVIYQTSHENLKQIPEVLKSIVLEQAEMVEFDRAHFSAYGDSSLDFEVVYFVLDSAYNTYMNIQQQINLRIYEEFKKMGVDFAYPTRTLYVANQKEEAVNRVATELT
ncbi:mechanosensitive ion channel family protein [soil metagenome]